MVSSAALIAATRLPRNWSVAVLVAPGFYLIDAMGLLDVFRAVQLKAFANVNLTSHQYRPDCHSIAAMVRCTSTCCAEHWTRPGKRWHCHSTRREHCQGATRKVRSGASPCRRAKLIVSCLPLCCRRCDHVVCVGSDILASLGLLDGREATTNSLLLWRSRKQWPMVRWVDLRDDIDRRFIVSQPPERILTTAGVTAGIDGALHYVSSWFGQHVAEAVREFVEWPLPLEQRVRTLH